MKTVVVDLSGVQRDHVMCSLQIKPQKKWVRVVHDRDNKPICIHKLRVERSLNSFDKWILGLHNASGDKNTPTHVFYLDFERCRARVFQS